MNIGIDLVCWFCGDDKMIGYDIVLMILYNEGCVGCGDACATCEARWLLDFLV